MKRLIALILLMAIGFYVAWPAYSLYQIKSAITDDKPELIAEKVDMVSVRETLRPAAETKVREQLAKLAGDRIPGGAAVLGPIVPKITDQVLSTLVTPANAIKIAKGTGAMADRVSALVGEQIAKVGGALKGLPGLVGALGAGDRSGNGRGPSIGGILTGLAGATQADRVRGFLGGGDRMQGAAMREQAPPPPEPPATEAVSGPPPLGFSNVKSFSFNGPLSYSIGLSQDPKADNPDAIVTVGFQDFDWKIIGIAPQI